MDTRKELPEKDNSDWRNHMAKAVLSFVPAATELWDMIITPSLARRRDEWLQSLWDDVKQLATAVQTVQEKIGDEAFTDAVLRATIAAARTRNRMKWETLRAAVLNSLLPSSPNDIYQELFFGAIEELSTSHVSLLRFLCEGKRERMHAWGDVRIRYKSEVKQKLSPDDGIGHEAMDVLLIQLKSLGFVTPHNDVLVLTERGQEFLRFITSPIQDSSNVTPPAAPDPAAPASPRAL